MTFHRAERKQAKLRLAICGPSGSGKTYSALLIAQGLAPSGKVALIDTERGSGELYSDLIEYDISVLAPPFTPQRYTSLIKEAEKAGYDVLIIDSLSHAWVGEGGVLDMHDKASASSKTGNSFTAWREVTPQHNVLVNAILGAGLHVIVTMRTKTAYEVIDEAGKKKPVKVGLAPVQREGMEYEFTTVLDLSVDGHIATASKDRTRLFDGQRWMPDIATGETLREWLSSGKENVVVKTIHEIEVDKAWKELKDHTLTLELDWDVVYQRVQEKNKGLVLTPSLIKSYIPRLDDWKRTMEAKSREMDRIIAQQDKAKDENHGVSA